VTLHTGAIVRPTCSCRSSRPGEGLPNGSTERSMRQTGPMSRAAFRLQEAGPRREDPAAQLGDEEEQATEEPELGLDM